MNNILIDLLDVDVSDYETKEAREHYISILKQIKINIQNDGIEKVLENIDGLISKYENKCPKCNSEIDYCIVKKEEFSESCEAGKAYAFCPSCNWSCKHRCTDKIDSKFGYVEIKLHPRLNCGFCETCGSALKDIY